jgi:hypothetical protein
MERPAPPRRPWYLLVAIVVAWLYGVGGCTEGSAVIGAYWSPAPDVTEIAARAKTEDDRAHVRDAATRCFVAMDQARRRVFPLGAGSFVLGAAIVIFAARSMAGRKTARSLLVQLVIAQAVFVGARDYVTRDIDAACFDFKVANAKLDFEGKTADPSIFDRVSPEMMRNAAWAGFGLRTLVAGLVVLSLTRGRTKEWYEAMERRRLERS